MTCPVLCHRVIDGNHEASLQPFRQSADIQKIPKNFTPCIDFTKRVCYNEIVKILSLVGKCFMRCRLLVHGQSASLFFIPVRFHWCTPDNEFSRLPSSTERIHNRKCLILNIFCLVTPLHSRLYSYRFRRHYSFHRSIG